VNTKNQTQQNGRVVIEDELTIYTVLELKETLLTALLTTDELELDLSGVSEIDGAGLQLLVMVKQESVTLGKTLRFIGHSPVVLELIDLSGLAGFFGDPLLIVRPSSSL
jgi:anti-sigma B factor antagonist